MIPVNILSVGLASPPYEFDQSHVAQVAQKMFGSFPQLERMSKVFFTAGINRRQAACPIDWYLEPRDWPERTEAYRRVGTDVFVGAAQRALEEAGLKASEVDIIVTVSSTGIATPSLEALAMTRMGFRSDAARVPVFGLGCAGGVTGLALAARLAAASPGANVLLVSVELCTLAFRLEDLSKADIVATALFGDGGAACVLSTRGQGFAQVTNMAEHTWPDTLDIMGWRMEPSGFGVIFDQSIPPFAKAHLRDAVDSLLDNQKLTVSDIDRFICHPGGMKVLDAFEESLTLPAGSLDSEREILSRHGNMSAPTALYVLDHVRRKKMPKQSILTALGPGFTISTVTLAG